MAVPRALLYALSPKRQGNYNTASGCLSSRRKGVPDTGAPFHASLAIAVEFYGEGVIDAEYTVRHIVVAFNQSR